MARRPRRTDRLPKTPLAEVVFELRWGLQGDPNSPPVVRTDPGLLPLLDKFTTAIKKHGFGFSKDMSPPLQTGGFGVARRFFKSAEKPFPIMQVGPGIFAANESTQYEWGEFKKQINLGLRTLLGSYPKFDFFAISPISLELRYIDVFDKSLLGKAALFYFAEHGTSLKFGFPPILKDPKIFVGDPEGRLIFKSGLKGWKDTQFFMDFASGQNNETKEAVVRMETKVLCEGPAVPKLNNHAKFISEVGDWLDFAHGITSPFFKQLVLPPIMAKFKGP
jgi:hypothetical protein